MAGEKFTIGLLLSLIILLFAALFSSMYGSQTFTGKEINLGGVDEGKQIEVVTQDTSYKLKVSSCNPFTIKVNGEQDIDGIPQDLTGTYCNTSYYLLEDSFSASKVEFTSGSPSVTISSEVPVGVTLAHPEDVRNSALTTIKVIALLIWAVLIVGLWFL